MIFEKLSKFLSFRLHLFNGRKLKGIAILFILISSLSLGLGNAHAETDSSNNDSNSSSNDLIIINKYNNRLAFFHNDILTRVFVIATGKTSDLVPEGEFKIVNKIMNRPYYKHNIKGGDPHNPLGSRWMGLNARGTWGKTYAIHGNNNKSSIGKYVSAGCVRMYNDEISWLYDRVEVNTYISNYSNFK